MAVSSSGSIANKQCTNAASERSVRCGGAGAHHQAQRNDLFDERLTEPFDALNQKLRSTLAHDIARDAYHREALSLGRFDIIKTSEAYLLRDTHAGGDKRISQADPISTVVGDHRAGSSGSLKAFDGDFQWLAPCLWHQAARRDRMMITAEAISQARMGRLMFALVIADASVAKINQVIDQQTHTAGFIRQHAGYRHIDVVINQYHRQARGSDDLRQVWRHWISDDQTVKPEIARGSLPIVDARHRRQEDEIVAMLGEGISHGISETGEQRKEDRNSGAVQQSDTLKPPSCRGARAHGWRIAKLSRSLHNALAGCRGEIADVRAQREGLADRRFRHLAMCRNISYRRTWHAANDNRSRSWLHG